MKSKGNKSQIEGLLVLVLFGIFAICILGVLLTGAGAYERLMQREQDTYAERTVPQYIATKVRQADTYQAVTIGEFGGVEALQLSEELNGEHYITRIYCYDGYLRELFSLAEGNFEPADGEAILKAEQVDFSLEQNCLTVTVTTEDGIKTERKLALRSTEGGKVQ